MKFIVFNGSPAGRNSNSNVIVEAFLQGAVSGGAEVENVFLCEHKIKHCQGCFACWFKTPGKCVIKDDMEQLLDSYNQADVVCFATPVYTWNMTAYLKNFVDRLAPLKSPLIQEKQAHYDLADTIAKKQQFVVISNCGFPGDHNFDVMKAVFQSCQPSLEIYRNCGKLLKTDNANVQIYLDVVSQAGYEMATTNKVSAETQAKLMMPLMAVEDYVKYLGMGS